MDWIIIAIIILIVLLIIWAALESKKDQKKNEQFFNEYLDNKRRIKYQRRSRRLKLFRKMHRSSSAM
jgi:TM2 domain-containing membrane protein YozV